MSVGGKVVETIVLDDRVWVNTREPQSGDLCAIYVERTPESRTMGEGDSLWWHGAHAYWTPTNRAFEDRKLKRIGFSGVSRPVASCSADR
jgi:hypothetical protein